MTSKKHLSHDTTAFLDAIGLASDGTNDTINLANGWFIAYTDEDSDNPSPIWKAAIRDNNLYIHDDQFQSVWSLHETTIAEETDEKNVFLLKTKSGVVEAIIYKNSKYAEH